MNPQLNYLLAKARTEDLLRQAAERRRAVPPQPRRRWLAAAVGRVAKTGRRRRPTRRDPAPVHDRQITTRFAAPEDDPGLRRLAALDSNSVPPAPLLLAEEDGELRAALSLRGSQIIADPFFPTADLVKLLRARAGRLEQRRPAAAERRPGSAARSRLPLPIAFAGVAAVIGIAFYASATPSPLYGVYQLRWHFSTAVLSLVYATYALGVLSSLVLVGGISDQAGRRPVLAWSLVALLVSMGLFVTATSLAWLFVARAVQGLATGAALGAAGAALIDLHPTGDARHASLVNGTVSLVALGAGAFISSLLVQFLPAPRVLPFAVVAALLALLLVLVGLMPDPVPGRMRLSLRPQRPAVPAAIRGAFILAALGVLSSWSIGGLYLALGPGLAGQLLHTHAALAGGAAVAALMAPGALAQLAGRDLSNRTLTTVGAILLAVPLPQAPWRVARPSRS